MTTATAFRPADLQRPDLDLRDFSRVGLDELNELASLHTRVDRKYVLPRADAETVVDALRWTAEVEGAPRVLEIDGHRSANYESVYFDTPDLLSYRMAAHARRRRFKLRTRSYVDTDEAYLEMKTRGARSTTVKDRIPYAIAARDVLTAEGREYATSALDSLGIPHTDARALGPTLVTRYRRSTLFLPSTLGRATLDVDLSWEGDDGSLLATPDLAIIETKSGARATEIDRLLWANGHRPSRISKFGTGLAALRPDLPSNKWARVLRRHFTNALRADTTRSTNRRTNR